MNHRIAALVVAGTLALTPAVFAGSPKDKSSPDPQTVAQKTIDLQVSILPLTLSTIFARAAQDARIINGEHGMQIADNPAVEVVIARRNTDGTLSRACVESEEAARRFFAARQPAESNATTQEH
jgi:hypothetical protein